MQLSCIARLFLLVSVIRLALKTYDITAVFAGGQAPAIFYSCMHVMKLQSPLLLASSTWRMLKHATVQSQKSLLVGLFMLWYCRGTTMLTVLSI
ncbi:hypothetical protein BD769DRAFT_1017003 [Suillus cothurnatus]|nr:hypothetical protein BD769DRAFT_1017003 [Suillus cothurnatus]